MSRTIVGLKDAKAVKRFSAFLAVDVGRKAYFQRKFMGVGVDAQTPLQLLPHLENDAGDQIAYALLLRLCCNALAELIFEEAYYWNYAQHLAIGYLDHPPMVGWLIWVFTGLLGDTEFAVRLGALLCWCIMAFYSWKLAATIFDREVALKVLLLVAVLPAFFSFGMIMLPDTPLVACWAGALYYLYRLLIEDKREAWLGAGIFLGLGLLSKYTVCLLGFSACAFILANRRCRKWLLRPEPYLSAFVAMLIFCCAAPAGRWRPTARPPPPAGAACPR